MPCRHSSLRPTSTPVAIGSRLFVCGGEGKDRNFSACLQMKAENGKITCQELYRSTEWQTNMYNTVAVYQDAVFGFGGGAKAGFLHCTDFHDGRLLWKEENPEWTKDRPWPRGRPGQPLRCLHDPARRPPAAQTPATRASGST